MKEMRVINSEKVCLSGDHASKDNNLCKHADDVTYLRWDQSPLDEYYEYTRIKLFCSISTYIVSHYWLLTARVACVYGTRLRIR